MKTPRSFVYLFVSVLAACSAQGGGSLPPSNNASCSAACSRIASTTGCTSMPNCEADCTNAASRVIAQCQASYGSFLSCASTSPVQCMGSTPVFTGCSAQMMAVSQCITNARSDGGLPTDDVSSPPPVDASGPPGSPTAPCATEMSGRARECGWNPGVNFTCTPGQMFYVGCNSTAGTGPECATPIGACMGDTVLRVCSGSAPCSNGEALGSEDDTCGTCPVATITCPASGMIHVLAGPFRTSISGTCVPAVRPATTT